MTGMFGYLQNLGAKLFRRDQIADEMNEELAAHIAHRADDLERSGLGRAEAERRAKLEFGAQERYKESSYEALGGNFVDTLIKDVLYSLRVLRKSRSFAITAVLTLAMAIGANAVVFSVLNALVLRPLNLPHANSLYGIERSDTSDPVQSYPDYLDLRDRNRSFQSLAAYRIVEAGVDAGKGASRTFGYEVSGNYFDMLGIQPYLGRFFHGSDERGPNSAPYVVLSYAYWHSRFQDDRSIVGRVLLLNKHPFTVVGIAPAGFHGTLLFAFPDFFFPMVDAEEVDGRNVLNSRGTNWIYLALGHLKAGVTPAQAIADLNAIAVYLKKTYPQEHGSFHYSLSRPGLYDQALGRPVEMFLTGLMLLAGLILLAACANLGSLFAARAADRSKEVALRLALGSSRKRILRSLFTEAAMISLAGGALGLAGSVVLLRALSTWQPLPRYPISVPVNPDANVYGMAVILAIVSTLLFGAVPVRQVLRTTPYQIVKAGSYAAAGRRISLRDLLLVVQIAICAVLVTSSMVAVRGLVRSLHSSFGFDPTNVTIVNTDLSMAGYNGERVPQMQRRMLDAMRAIPGVESVGLVDWPPLISGAYGATDVYRDQTGDLSPANAVASPFSFRVSPDYFQAAGTTLLAGRTFSWQDDENAPRVAVVNPELASKVFGSTASALGHSFKLQDGARVRVVGIAESGKYKGITDDGDAAMFLPFLQSPTQATNLVIRSSRDPRQVEGSVRKTLRALDPGLPSYIETWNQQLDDFALFPTHVAVISLGVLGMMGALLSITGIFGMAAYSVSKRVKELGIRIALGARKSELLRAALGRALKLLAAGSSAGLVLGVLASRVLSHIVYQATPRDPLVLAGVVLAMAILGLIATWVPAQRALSVDPLILLREE
jgi:predicted permease